MKIALILAPTKGHPYQKDGGAVGNIYEGKDELDILFKMKSGSMMTDCLTIEEYVKLVKKMVYRFYKKRIRIRGFTNLEKAENLIAVLKALRLAFEIL